MVSRLTARDERAQPYLLCLSNLDRLIHEPARLRVLGVLARCQGSAISYTELHKITGLLKGNLSNHLTKLEGAKIVEIHKRFVGKRPQTSVTLTRFGGERLVSHLEEMADIKEALEAIRVEEE